MDVNEKPETKSATPQSMEDVLKQARYWLAAAVVPVLAVREQLLARIDAALASRDAATAAQEVSSEYSRGVREGLERAGRVCAAAAEEIKRRLHADGLGMGWAAGEALALQLDSAIRSLAAQEGREPE